MNVYIVIVTYNRLTLLKESIEAVLSQTYTERKLVVVDNKSTDGTDVYLQEQQDLGRLSVLNLPKNIGGAGGFSKGIEYAVKNGASHVWIMDDDTIPSPTALEMLVKGFAHKPNAGFICSKVNWTNGMPHLMNRPILQTGIQDVCVNDCSIPELPLLRASRTTFVSVMFNTEAVRKVGLPYEEFFIWGDDIEYTGRIINNGYSGFYLDNSIVVHKTASNYHPDPKHILPKDMWKLYYQARNECFQWFGNMNIVMRTFSCMRRFYWYVKDIVKCNPDNKCEFLKIVWKGCVAGIRFNPQIKYVN